MSFSRKMLKLSILFFFGAAGVCFSQTGAASDSCEGPVLYELTDTVSINPTLPKYRVHFISRNGCYSIYVFAGESAEAVQHIANDCEYVPAQEDEIRIEDANFDGYRDILVLSNIGNTGNEDYDFWLFDPESRRFKFSSEFTDSVQCNPYIDRENKEISAGGEDGCIGMCFDQETYKVVGGHLVLVEHFSQELFKDPTDSTGPVFVRTIQKLENGRMKTVHRVTGTIEHIDSVWKDYWQLE